ncbi:2-succinyl-6-hydroxy-2,4-cyclohexadiene-1-carboxylate synthase [Weissella paramesenteroides]|uniref:2-succinyl-6-hydroxy-2, 4-cyclohexadiene-1-carboxylate synthase n=1 Tax=Weissella paramesenteroides TaxID=1249 RepID=UPI003F7437F1
MRKQVSINGYEYELEIQGTGKPTWLFFHGFMGSLADYQGITPTGTRIYMNLLGFGSKFKTVQQPQRFMGRQQVMDICRLLDKLSINKVNLVGYSMGARLALVFGSTVPKRINHLVLESGTAGLVTQNLRQQRIIADIQKADRVEQVGMSTFIHEWEQLPLFKSQKSMSTAQQLFMHEQRLNQNAQNVANSLRFFGTGAMSNLWSELAYMNIPVTLITGMNDHKFTKINQKMQQQLPNVQWCQVPQAGHNVHFERPNQVIDILNTINH